jgi:HEAT repeat protein/beta-lactamase regulating signal transducer with metallopeptidase domain
MTISEFPSGWMLLLDNIAKATVVLGVAGVTTYALRRASAALRHYIWTLALVSAIVMPLLSMALPRWEMPIVTVASVDTAASAPDIAAPPTLPRSRSTDSRSGAPLPTTASESAAPRFAISGAQALFGIWALGLVLIAGRMLVGVVAVQWMARRSDRVLDAPWMKMAIELASEVGVTSNITFLRSERAAMPMACGVLRPAVMMPKEADEWPAERLRIVLLHELAHVKRHDCLTHLVAQMACALHWFNPLAWIAARNVRTERERACDDLVLAAGTRGPDYADQLLEIARVMRSGHYPAVLAGATLAMAHRSQLEGRLMAILDPRVPHAALTKLRAAAATTVCCAAVVPLAAVQPWTSIPDAPSPAIVMEQVQPLQPVAPPAPATAPQPSAAANGVAAMPPHGAGGEGANSGSIHQPLQDAQEDQAEQPENGHDGTSQAKGDPRMIAALTAALKDSDKEVRETAMHALVQLRDPAIYDPLLQALKDASADVREQAAFGLGQLRDKRAVPALGEALKDQNPDVRQQAAFALGQLRDRASVTALTAAMKDTDADVREQAVFALGQIRDPAAVEGLTVAVHDGNADVRQQAVFALGQIRDRRAVEPLISALKDSDADVREQAAFALGQIRDRGAVEALIIALKDNAASVREQVVFALGQIRDPRAIEGLTTALKDPQPAVRQQAAFALGQIAQ